MKLLTLFLSIAILTTSCTEQTSEEKVKEQKINFLVFQFHDASVPPEYHRSFTLTFETDKAHLLVDSYGDIITDTQLNLNKETIQKIFSLVDKHQIKNKEKKNVDEGCTGGTGVSIKYGFEKEVFCNGYVYFCGGTTDGDLQGDLKAFEKEILEMIPEFNYYLKN